MKEPKTIRGLWWLPNAPERRFGGDLVVSPDKLPKLTLLIEHGNDAIMQEHLPVLHGAGDGGKDLTLSQVSLSGSESSSAFIQARYSVGKLFSGVHLLEPEQALFHRVDFTMQHLHTWCATTGFTTPQYKERTDLILHYKVPERKIYNLASGWQISFNIGSSTSFSSRRQNMEEEIDWLVERNIPFTLSEAMNLALALRKLVHFACLEKVHLMSVAGYRPNDVTEVGPHSIPNEIEVVGAFCHGEVEKDLSFHDFIYLLPDLPSSFELVFEQWLNFCRNFQEPLGCYSNTVYNQLTSELELAALTQGLEAFHALKSGKAENVSFYQRILELVQSHHTQAPWAFGANLEEFVETVRDNRNYYTHHNPKWKVAGRVKSSTELIWLNESLAVLFRLCVLAELGVTLDPHNVLRRHYPHRVVSFG